MGGKNGKPSVHQPHCALLNAAAAAAICTCAPAPIVPLTATQAFMAHFPPIFNEVNINNVVFDYYFDPQIGDYLQGGVVFYLGVFQGRRTALICAIRDAGFCDWGPYLNDTTGIQGIGFFTGRSNTQQLCAKGPQYKAAQAASQYTDGKYHDWYLPSTDELKEIYNKRALINATALQKGGTVLTEKRTKDYDDLFWSSSEYDANLAWYVYFYNGNDNYGYNKNHQFSVRPVRAFNY